MELLKDRLLKYRLDRKLRQKEMADKLGTELTTYRSWERGKRTPTKLTQEALDHRLELLTGRMLGG